MDISSFPAKIIRGILKYQNLVQPILGAVQNVTNAFEKMVAMHDFMFVNAQPRSVTFSAFDRTARQNRSAIDRRIHGQYSFAFDRILSQYSCHETHSSE